MEKGDTVTFNPSKTKHYHLNKKFYSARYIFDGFDKDCNHFVIINKKGQQFVVNNIEELQTV